MQLKNLTEVLVGQGWDRIGDIHVAPPGAQATLFLSFRDDALIVEHVVRIELDHEVAVATTGKHEQYAVELDGVLALRFTFPRDPRQREP